MGFLKKRKKIENGWKILIVDDEEAIHDVTKLALKNFKLDDKKIEFLSAMSAREAREILKKENDIALILLDVVMESDHAGLELVEFIRQELQNHIVRIILRTGQPGYAPEKQVIDQYDINDYKEKTELTTTKLYGVIRTGLKTYKYINSLENNKKSLEYIIKSAPNIYEIKSLNSFFESVLTSIVNLLQIIEEKPLENLNSFIAYPISDSGSLKVCNGVGKFKDLEFNHEEVTSIISKVTKDTPNVKGTYILEDNNFIIPIIDKNDVVAFIYVEENLILSEYTKYLLDVFSIQVAVSFKNIDLYELLSHEHNETINMLALASEYKDEDTGEHVKRIEKYTTLLALELGFSVEEAEEFGRASILHDIGKLAVDDDILRKPSKLTSEEFEKIKLHPVKGYKILNGHSYFKLASEIAYTHHERYDGNGYPQGLKGEDIPISGRIVALIDVYDALSNKRPYKDAWNRKDVSNYIKENSGKHFDPKVVKAFLQLEIKGLLK